MNSAALHPAIAAGKVAVVTGAASGIGLAAARSFAEAGMHVVMADVDADALRTHIRQLASDGLSVSPAIVDVGARSDIERLCDQARRQGQVSLLMNNAAREGGGSILAGAEVWEDRLRTNLLGPLYAIQTFLPDMLSAAWPCAIVNTGSKQGITLPPGDTAYNVSKAGLKALTESLAHDLQSTGGRVTAHLLIPGFTFTGFTRARGVKEKPQEAWTPEQVIDFMLPAMAAGDFYILCPDNEVTTATDRKRIAWASGDIVENRPPLSRWHPDYADAFAAFMKA